MNHTDPTTRELLELAAKAMGLELIPMEMNNVAFPGDYRFIGFMTKAEQWPRGWFYPATIQADSDRMACTLEIDISWHSGYVIARAFPSGFEESDQIEKLTTHDGTLERKCAAVREARLLVAAEIGRTK
jgi:hypothetical protein